MRKRRGRPLKATKPKAYLQVRASEEDKADWLEAAQKEGFEDLSTCVRYLLRQLRAKHFPT